MMYSLLFLLVPVANAVFSVHFASKEHDVKVADNHFKKNLEAEHVADLFARISGRPPTLHEDTMDLPSADILSPTQANPAILEVFGGNIEDLTTATEVARTDAVRGPTLSSIHSALLKHNIRAVASKTVDLTRGDDHVKDAKEWMDKHPDIVVLHHDYVAGPRTSRRTTSEYTNSTGLTEEEINDYQIFLWVSVVFVLFLLSSVCVIANMDVIPDSILFAKFQSARTNKID